MKACASSCWMAVGTVRSRVSVGTVRSRVSSWRSRPATHGQEAFSRPATLVVVVVSARHRSTAARCTTSEAVGASRSCFNRRIGGHGRSVVA